ncbi:uncharacterized protein LOC124927883 isoform X2 [Impatiens glandulifera]|uniref:uncharacterized protein LOC124927883 isoform X2 n=1 Tax=Impatiens glandulifera TaxID=253017 RepID=UPI001FB0A388|nr:uncharacterized protein LOC124927883 isoform X2 [Impatiens glandulifera]
MNQRGFMAPPENNAKFGSSFYPLIPAKPPPILSRQNGYPIEAHVNQQQEFTPVRHFRKSKGLTIRAAALHRNEGLYNHQDLPTQNVSFHSNSNSYMPTLPIIEGSSWNDNNLSSTKGPNEGPSWAITSKDNLMLVKGKAIAALETPKPIEENTPPQTNLDSFSHLNDSNWTDCNFTKLLMETEDFGLDSLLWSNTDIFTETARDESAALEFKPVYDLNSPPESEADAISCGTNLFKFRVATPDHTKQVESRYHVSADENSSQEKEFAVPAENVNVLETLAANGSSEVIDINILQQQEGGKGTDPNKTPKQKTPKRRKHRPKVIIEGKAKKIPKAAKGKGVKKTSLGEKRKYVRKSNLVEMENGATNSKEKKLNGKRKYARKNKEPIPEHQPETSTKSCRKALDFDLEIEQGLEIQMEARNEVNQVVETDQHNACTVQNLNPIARRLKIGQSDQTREQNNQVTAAQENLFHDIRQTDENSGILEGNPLLSKRSSSDHLVTGPEFLKKMRTENGFLQMPLNSPPTVPSSSKRISTSVRNFNMLSSPNCYYFGDGLISRVNDTFTTNNSVDFSSHSEAAMPNTHQPQTVASFPFNIENSQSSVYLCNNILGMPHTDQQSLSQNQRAFSVGYHQQGTKSSEIKALQEQHLEQGAPSKVVVTDKNKTISRKQKHGLNCTPNVSVNEKGLLQKEKEKIITVDQLIDRLKDLSIYDYRETTKGKMALVPYKEVDAVVPYEGFDIGKKKQQRPKVDLDPETDRVWKLLMGSKEGSEANEAEDKDKASEKWWDEERKVFHGRVESFIARMHLVQGDRRFSRWKGSVVDSVIGVFLTQNVSDHLSSSAFMSLVAKYAAPKESPVQNWFQGESSVSEKAPILQENLFTHVVSEKAQILHENLFTRISENAPILHENLFTHVVSEKAPILRENLFPHVVSEKAPILHENLFTHVVSEKAPILHENLFTHVVSEKVPERPSVPNSYSKQGKEDFGSSDNPNCDLQLHDEVISWVEPSSKPQKSMNRLHYPSSSTHFHTTAQTTTFEEWRSRDQLFHRSTDLNFRRNDATEVRRQFSLLDKYDDAKYLSTGAFAKTDFYPINAIMQPTTPEKGRGSFSLFGNESTSSVSPFWSEVSSSKMNHSSKNIGNKAKDIVSTVVQNRRTSLYEAQRNGLLSEHMSRNPIQEQCFPISSPYINKYTNSADTHNQEKLSLQHQKGFNRVPSRHEQMSSKIQIGDRQQVPISPNKGIFMYDEMPNFDNVGRQQVPISPNKGIFPSTEMLYLDNGSRQVPISPNKGIFLSDEMLNLDNGNRQQVPNHPMYKRQAIIPDKRIFVADETPILENGGRQQVPNDPMYKRQTNSSEKSTFVGDDILKLDNGAVDSVSAKEHVHSSGESNHGTAVNTSSKKKAKPENEKAKPFDWDSLRRDVEANGKRKERRSDAMDSLDYDAIRKATVREISNTIKERGMNNMLAERIKDFLDRLVKEHGAVDLEWLRDVPPDKSKDFLLSIRGLGLKSVECVRLLTLHHLAFPVDTNVGRIAVRLGWVPLRPLPESLQLHLLELYPMLETIQKYLWPRLCKLDQRTLYELHYQMITFGKVFCTKSKPNCNACPLRGECRHFASAFASARLSLPGPEEGGKIVFTSSVPTPVKMKPLQLPTASNSILSEELGSINRTYEPIVEEPASPPEPERVEITQSDIEDLFYEDPDEIPTIKLNIEEFTQNLHSYMQENMDLQESDFSKALVALTPEIASIPAAKLKNVSRLRTEHQVYELPDSHPLLKEMERREPDDPSPYLLAIWTPGETASSIQLPERSCGSQDTSNLCNESTCFSCNSIREANAQIVRGTLLIPCRTAMRGSFPLNGTYFQVNEMFADHESSVNPINVPRSLLWNLPRRTVCFGTSVTSIFKGLSTEGIQQCFWRGFVCVRGFDQKSRVPRPLLARLHFSASKLVKVKNDEKKK